MQVSVLVFDGVFDSGLAAILDTLETANALAGELKLRGVSFEVLVCGLRRRATTHQGLGVRLAPLPEARPDLVIVPALGSKTVPTIAAALERRDVAEGASLLQAWSRSGVRIAGACTATFVLASSGILDGGSATTTWWLSPLFRQRFPQVTLDESRMIVVSSKVVTAGAALAHFDLALWLVGQRSPTLARACSKHLVFEDARPSQAPFVMPDHLAHADPLVGRFEQWARRNLAAFSLPDAARAVGASERTLGRKVQAVLGRSPLAYVQDLRVEHAVHRLRTTHDTLDQIAELVGYQDATTLRTLIRRKTGRGVRELRHRSGGIG
jgi:transcriptional regulator GlxA family with amidase domain